MTIDHASLRTVVASYLAPYLAHNSVAAKALEVSTAVQGVAVYGHDNCHLWDHLAFRTFDSDGCGIDALAAIFTELGYTRRDELRFDKKKLVAYWFTPPVDQSQRAAGGAHQSQDDVDGLDQPQHDTGVAGRAGPDGPSTGACNYPRIFVSYLLVDQLSPAATAVVHRYTSAAAGSGSGAIANAARAGRCPWPTPTLADYNTLAAESEYAAWTLVHGFGLNHVAISVHQLVRSITERGGGNSLDDENRDDLSLEGGCKTSVSQPITCLEDVIALLMAAPHSLLLNAEGGVVKVSPDGLLRQSATSAQLRPMVFACGGAADVPGGYIEFAERLALPHFAEVEAAGGVLREDQRRDGFEVGNADKIFESTYVGQTGAR